MNAVVQTTNPFGAMATQSNAIADAKVAGEIAEIQAAMTVAKRFPRNAMQAMDSILNARTRPTLAEGALYSYSKGGSDVTGPSIRLAESLAQAWGNMQFGIRELDQRHGESTVEAYAWDLESNTKQSKVFQVRHIRHTKKGAYNLEDPRDIYELVANQGARRLRACILGVIPSDVIEAAVKQCEETLRASADTSADGVKKIVAAFEPFGVTREQIEKRLQVRIDAIRPAQVVILKKIYASLRDGMSAPGDWFEAPAAAIENKATDKPATLRGRVTQAIANQAKPAEIDPDTGEVIPENV